MHVAIGRCCMISLLSAPAAISRCKDAGAAASYRCLHNNNQDWQCHTSVAVQAPKLHSCSDSLSWPARLRCRVSVAVSLKVRRFTRVPVFLEHIPAKLQQQHPHSYLMISQAYGPGAQWL